MPFVTTGRENSAEIRIYYEDHGTGSPVVLVHGYALNGRSWEKQEAILLAAGHRVITYDRRGFGASSRPSVGYDFDTLAGDLHVPLSRLNFRGVVLAGFAMGTGEVARYLAVHGSGRVSAAVLVAPLPPFLLKTGSATRRCRALVPDQVGYVLKRCPVGAEQGHEGTARLPQHRAPVPQATATTAKGGPGVSLPASATFKSGLVCAAEEVRRPSEMLRSRSALARQSARGFRSCLHR
jgi:pimeloyl-ACP methyl ester carboxylesterase